MGGVKVARGTNSIIFADLGGAAPELSLVLRVCACLQTRRAAYEPGTPGRFRGKASPWETLAIGGGAGLVLALTPSARAGGLALLAASVIGAVVVSQTPRRRRTA